MLDENKSLLFKRHKMNPKSIFSTALYVRYIVKLENISVYKIFVINFNYSLNSSVVGFVIHL
jgi:hypothetical protein